MRENSKIYLEFSNNYINIEKLNNLMYHLVKWLQLLGLIQTNTSCKLPKVIIFSFI